MVHFADDKNGTDNSRGQALQNNGLVIVYGYLRTIVCERDGVWRGRWIVWLRWWWWWNVEWAASRFGNIDDIHDKRVWGKM
jgi:hypothetical protein